MSRARPHRRWTDDGSWPTEKNGSPLTDHFLHLVITLPLKGSVADGQHLVEDENLRCEVRGDGEGQPQVHPRRVMFDRRVQKLLHLGEGDYLVELAPDLAALHAEDSAVEKDVLSSGQVWVEARAYFEQASESAVDVHLTRGRPDDAREDF